MMQPLTVALGEHKYDIIIENGSLDRLGSLVKPFRAENERTAVVTDEHVWELYGDKFSAAMERAGVAFRPVILPPGEQNKSMDGLSDVFNAFAEMRLTRGGLVIAFGGGVIGDLCGFAAAVWMRGVRFIQVPTTLLAQVDSGVGGKTAINLSHGKNLVGAFYQPKLVVIDPLTLGSLPEREIRCGMSEVIKYGAIRSADLFRRLGARPAIEEFPDIIRACCRVKSEIVARDELDAGERMILNFGHTFGHAVERYYDFERYNHGEAVAIGMVAEASIGEEMGITVRGAADALADLLALYGLDADCRDVLCAGGISDALPRLLRSDKKSRGNGLDMVFLHEIGDARARYVDFAEIEHAFERYKGRRNN